MPEAPDPLYAGELCRGFRLIVTEPDRFLPVRTGLSAIALLRQTYPEEFEWEARRGVYLIDRLLGTDIPRTRLENGDSVEAILQSLDSETERFLRRREPYLLYP
jgi:uncharacterized protein YbbC (DUF1343 family)